MMSQHTKLPANQNTPRADSVGADGEHTAVEPLTESERETLRTLEESIQQHKAGFLEVASALASIHRDRLYRETDHAFESYVRRRWGFGKAHAYRLIDAARVVEKLDAVMPSPIGDIPANAVLPTSESQARELAKAPETEQQAVWSKAVATAPRDDAGLPIVTAAHVRSVVAASAPTPREDQVSPATRGPGPDLPNAVVNGVPALPWAELEAGILEVISDLRAVKRKLARATDYDFTTKRMRSRWARAYDVQGTFGAIDVLMFSLRDGLPAELSDDDLGFRTAGQVKRHNAAVIDRRA